MGGDSAVTGEQSCPTCGARVRVVGETTRSYEPVEPASTLAALRARIEALPGVTFYEQINNAHYGPIPDTCGKSDVLAVIKRLTREGGDQ